MEGEFGYLILAIEYRQYGANGLKHTGISVEAKLLIYINKKINND